MTQVGSLRCIDLCDEVAAADSRWDVNVKSMDEFQVHVSHWNGTATARKALPLRLI